ncbi:MAG TPA: hypothetical protein VKZ63_10935 [Kofleriaceae bacterium]|nr:hypothetical protein [Kofleriaceae bacterium]
MKRRGVAPWALAGALSLFACGGTQQAAPANDRPLPDRLAGGTVAEEPAAQDPAGGDDNPLGRTRRLPERGPEGAALAREITPDRGFIDDPLAFDGAGGRLLYVQADTADLCDLVVFDLAAGAEVARVSLKAFTTAPLAVEDIDGERFLVRARPATDSEEVVAAVIDRSGAVVKTYGPSTDVVRTSWGGQDAVAVYRRAEKTQRKQQRVVHTVDLFALASGKRLGRRATIDTDASGYSKKLDFRLNHWAAGYTVAIGIKGGEYNRKKDQRMPDVEGWLDVPRGTFSKRLPITEVIEHTRRMQLLAQHSNRGRFVVVAQDLSGLILHGGEAAPAAVELAEPFNHYLRDSLVVQDAPADRPLFFSLAIDPVHADAVKEKRAVEPWLDLYRLDPGATRAERVARLPIADGDPGRTWVAAPGTWAVVPRHVGFARGGPSLQIYAVGAAAAGQAQPQPAGQAR